ncbi:hypothetical protein [Azotobacter chroococcum]|uniref:hypothetical protein n=1 Tax=Azotobacter chroococcum TaxID=353 RepID=UPI000B600BBD|nr:hypothetical protein [Azotobacter chroococcum]ASL26208.1 hypothetical protein ACG10_07720 [Azotobacter chroococcum]
MSKPSARVTTSAKVQLTIKISNVGSWGPGCDLAQVYRQAAEAAVARVLRALNLRDVRVIGAPIVKAITTDMEQTK